MARNKHSLLNYCLLITSRTFDEIKNVLLGLCVRTLTDFSVFEDSQGETTEDFAFLTCEATTQTAQTIGSNTTKRSSLHATHRL